MSFTSLGLAEPLLRAVAEQGYDTPSPIQQQAIPAVLAGRDLMAAAQTGTGKTAGFTLPMLQRLTESKRKVSPNRIRALVLTPTRELAAQVGESVRNYGKHLPIRSHVVFGGVSINPQMMATRRGLDVLVACPGRLMDLYNQNAVKFDEVEILVLDEADRMLDMGFIRDIRRILALLPKKRQNLLFSTTIAANIALGKPEASQEEIERVARIACVHDDIVRFPRGYETEVGEKGVTLSGGQKQRLAIARALLLDAPILVLDDALSAVDAHTEQQILLALKAHRRTLILVSHRMTAVEQANEILVLEQGAISERGAHGALMTHNGWYADMVRYQRLEQDVEESL